MKRWLDSCMERVLQNMGNNMGNTVAYFVQIIGNCYFLSNKFFYDSQIMKFSKYYLGSLCIVWQKETKLMSIYNTAISVIHWKFIRVRTRKVVMFFYDLVVIKFKVGECEAKNFSFGSRWDFDSFTTWWNGTTDRSTTWFVKTWWMIILINIF